MRRLLALLPLFAACGEEPARSPEAPPLEVHDTALLGEPAPENEVKVEVLDPGREPRRRLRYRLEPGVAQTMTTSEQLTMSMVVGGSRLMERELPSSSTTYRVSVAGLEEGEGSGEARARIAFELESGSPNDVSGVFGGRDEARATLEALEGRVIQTVLDERGLEVEREGAGPAGADRDKDQLAEQTVGPAIKMIVTPLPEEPIGPGGRWRVTRASYSYGLYLPLVTEYSIVELDGTRVVTETHFEGGAPAQKLGPFVDLRSLEGESDGRLVLDLGQPAPVESSSSSSFTMKMRTRSGGEVSDFSMVMEEEREVVSR